MAAASAIALAAPFAVGHADAATTPTAVEAAPAATSYTAAQVLAGVQQNSTTANQVNSKPHINTMTRAQNVNVYQVAPGVYSYTSGMAIDTDGSDSDPDPDHQGETTWEDSNGQALGAHHVPFYVLGDDCWDEKSPCPHFFYKEHGMSGRQFALMFYNGKVIGSIFGDTQTANSQTTSDNDSRELGEASVKAAQLLGIPSSGTTGGVDNGVTVVMFSGSKWVVNGTNSNLNTNTQALVQTALDSLGASMNGGTTPPSSPPPTSPPPSGNVSYEAEAAALAGGTTVTSCAHCSGGQKLSYLGNGGTATFNNISEPAAGSYTMTVSFMSVGQARTAIVTVNGVKQTVSFPETPDYNTVVTKNVTVQLKAGTNTIQFSNPTAGAPNLDRITL
ncbi:glycoside hydrolase family 75 protein [Streptomyces sp. NBC_01239]|uniref:glycoside hydrolase family 75 protein n=1 Tax=Streptomyces sp. NBC_01239 TaxID=2903792 RepID=UPI002259FD16|nr:glycoside hydrolase family 75 protein [Streptomyces sp. NBC_01239]MCX4817778.1 glycoside hydrolase family 75 protein [Streptomyces sp. NBC_01239]